jgi:hypothetical protein
MDSHKPKASMRVSGTLLAVAAAGIFAAGHAPTAAAAESAKVRCLGVNACKGKSECKTAAAQKGQNACKGHGLLFLTEEQCKLRGGKIDKHRS